MRHAVILPLILLGSLAACDRGSGLFAERSIPIVAPAASAEAAPRFVGRWASSTDQCVHPWVIQAHSLKAASANCDFDKIESNSAGYTVDAVCQAPGGMTPVRLSIATPDQARISLLTISGGPFRYPVPLQRCAAAQSR
jgi:hypothetical protein